jgi:phosphoribosylformimino-5-aminoimidazole carboxamide ribonucleotide (ProFAR) isomerase
MAAIEDAPDMLLVRLRDGRMAAALVVAEHAERAAFARYALAIKLRELDEAVAQRDVAQELVDRVVKECRDLAVHCERHDADFEAAIRGDLRRAR